MDMIKCVRSLRSAFSEFEKTWTGDVSARAVVMLWYFSQAEFELPNPVGHFLCVEKTDCAVFELKQCDYIQFSSVPNPAKVKVVITASGVGYLKDHNAELEAFENILKGENK